MQVSLIILVLAWLFIMGVNGLQMISSSSSSSLSLPPPTAADVAFCAWTKRVGIVAPLLTCRTTPQSVGGRGLFATTCGTSTILRPGTVLASIPQELILKSSDQEDWAADITQQVRHLDPNDSRTEWVNAWSGGGCTNWEDALQLAGSSSSNSNCGGGNMNAQLETEVRRQLDKRQTEWQSAAAKYQLDPLHDFALYALVSSRACFLGPSWTTTSKNGSIVTDIGIVPLFDMLNHVPHDRTVNVELMSVGTAFSKMNKDSSPNKPADLRERDMLLVATKAIESGQELFTEYLDENYNHDDPITALETKAKKLVQWGFL